jgi:beta-phosphoglucomutase-like phosphatase (HAD superfamily)
VAFEDSATGLAAARAAGLATVAVPTHDGDLAADWVLPGLDHPSIGRWLAAW